ncbi:MAG: GtrA family protein [Chloroflexota bacterium]
MTKFTKSETLRYILVGGLNTGITYLIYLLVLLFAQYIIAYTVSYVSGIVISYVLNSLLVFRQPLQWSKAIQYPVVYVVQFIIGSILITFFVEVLAIDPSLAALANVIVLLPISFILTRFILTRDAPPSP